MSVYTPSQINLASKPFRQERAQNAGYALGGVALLCCLLILFSLIVRERAQASAVRDVIAKQQAQLHTLQQSEATYSRILNKPANADVFAQSLLLNQMIARRSVSWTRVFGDLGTVLPSNMRLLSIRLPQVAAEGNGGRNRVQLDMWVGTEQPPAMVRFMQALQASKLFGTASMMSQAPPTQNDPMYKYRLTVAYAQHL